MTAACPGLPNTSVRTRAEVHCDRAPRHGGGALGQATSAAAVPPSRSMMRWRFSPTAPRLVDPTNRPNTCRSDSSRHRSGTLPGCSSRSTRAQNRQHAHERASQPTWPPVLPDLEIHRTPGGSGVAAIPRTPVDGWAFRRSYRRPGAILLNRNRTENHSAFAGDADRRPGTFGPVTYPPSMAHKLPAYESTPRLAMRQDARSAGPPCSRAARELPRFHTHCTAGPSPARRHC